MPCSRAVDPDVGCGPLSDFATINRAVKEMAERVRALEQGTRRPRAPQTPSSLRDGAFLPRPWRGRPRMAFGTGWRTRAEDIVAGSRVTWAKRLGSPRASAT